MGALLGQVVTEQAGPELFELVERVRRRTIALRHDDDPEERRRLDEDLAGSTSGPPRRSSAPSRCTSSWSTWSRRAGGCGRSGAANERPATASSTTRWPRRSAGCAGPAATDAELDALLGRLSIALVLTAHPTEARRRTALVALRRCAALLERLDDPRLTPSEDREIRRRLREEITLLWRTSDLRAVAPAPLDEVRTAMAFFDATLFTVVPRLYRALDAALDPPAVATGAPAPRPTPGGPARGRRASARSCAGAAGSAATATATRA